MNYAISKIILQKTAKKQEEYIVNQFKSKIPNDWVYVNYCNGEEVQFFIKNPLDDFPDIIKKWNNLPTQQHKADLFRYYYLYIYGGVILDGDAMIYDNIENIIKDYNFISVIGLDTSTLCVGYICTFPKNPILYEALKYIYNLDVSMFINSYNLLCKNLHDIVHYNTYNFKIKLYKEFHYTIGESAKVIGDVGNIIMVHYYKYKIIPKFDIKNKTTNIEIGSSDKSVKLITLTRSFKNPIYKLNTNPYGYKDNFDFEMHNNILIVKRIDAGYGWGYNHIVEITDGP